MLNKYNNFKNNKIINVNNENRGGNNKIFTEKEEQEIIFFLRENFINKNKMLCDDIIKLYALDKCKKLYPNKKFNASNGWCDIFKQKWNLSTVKCSISKISSIIYTNEEINIFLKKCRDSLSLVNPFFFNLDETKWNNVNVSLTTIHFKKSGNAKININVNEKEGFTLTLIISASGIMLKPILTAKGKTTKCLKKYNLNDSILGTYSNNGWSNCGIMKIILEQIFIITKGKKSILLLDQFPSHTDKFVVKDAESKNIELIFVPKGLTYKYQPLDVLINGILKQKAKKMWRQEIVRNPNIKITNADAVKHFLKAKEEITSEIIIKSFYDSCFIPNII